MIPARIIIGVTGHRKLDGVPQLAGRVREALQRISGMAPPLRSTPPVITLLSALAEGADRLVAREVLKMPGADLEAVLPLDRDDYLRDFATAESKREFEELLGQARSVRILPPERPREEAYCQAGRYIVEHCDVLIAVWDGKPATGRGGTAEIMEYARRTQHTRVWVHSESPHDITFEPDQGPLHSDRETVASRRRGRRCA